MILAAFGKWAQNAFGEFVNRQFNGIADVSGQVFVGLTQFVDSIDQIGNETEAAGLLAVAIHGDGLAAESLIDEIGEGAAIVQAHARTVSIKDADDVRVDTVEAVIGHGDGLSEALGFIVNAARTDRIYATPIGFRLRGNVGISVTLAGGSEKKFRGLLFGEIQGVHGGDGADFQGFDGKLQIIGRTRGRRKVKNIVQLAIDMKGLVDIGMFEAKFRIALQMKRDWIVLP